MDRADLCRRRRAPREARRCCRASPTKAATGPRSRPTRKALASWCGAIADAGLEPGADVGDRARHRGQRCSRAGRYQLALENRALSAEQLHAMLLRWIERYPIVSIEDPLRRARRRRACAPSPRPRRARPGRRRRLLRHLRRAGEKGRTARCNAVLLKPNQVGTVTRDPRLLGRRARAGYRAIVSARSGETEDVSIVHLAVGWGVGQLKVGSFSRSRAHGEVERGAAHRGGARIEGPLPGPDAIAYNR